jgi:hypothetical protein
MSLTQRETSVSPFVGRRKAEVQGMFCTDRVMGRSVRNLYPAVRLRAITVIHRVQDAYQWWRAEPVEDLSEIMPAKRSRLPVDCG